MKDSTRALLRDLQNDLDEINKCESNIEVIWELEKMKNSINFTIKQIKTTL